MSLSPYEQFGVMELPQVPMRMIQSGHTPTEEERWEAFLKQQEALVITAHHNVMWAKMELARLKEG